MGLKTSGPAESERISFSDRERESIGRFVKFIKTTTDEVDQAKWRAKAEAVVEELRKTFPEASDQQLAAFASAISYMMAQFATMSTQNLAATINSMFAGYALSAALLLGIYDTPPETTEPVEDKPEADASWNPDRMYL